ncbi:Hypothetical predicted protein [Olea europaea subsp. europaea]|uniref:Uncharacterized protein n=1 Tax=Olea europaea subsp. europaea TaxID=158383 RepID=A0A8S0SRF5_OLEEU|nr:Hypothetical predicted protein [Olea europaea subsp. europaea]
MSNHKVLPTTPAGSTTKAPAKVLIQTKAKETVAEDASEKSDAAGDVLGLSCYTSDVEDEEIQSFKTDGTGKTKANTVCANLVAASTELNIERVARELAYSDNQRSTETESGVAEDETQHVCNTSKSEETVTRKARNAKKSTMDDSPSRRMRHRLAEKH